MKIYKVNRLGFKAFLEYDYETEQLVRYTNPIVIDSNGTIRHLSKAWYSKPQRIGDVSIPELMRITNGEPVFVINRCGYSYGDCNIYCGEKYKGLKRKGFELIGEI